MFIGPGKEGIGVFVLLGDGERIPANLNDESVVIMRRGASTNYELVVVKELGELADPSLLRPPPPPVCNFPSDGNPLHKHADGWWFYNETWAWEKGPFATEEEGYAELEKYCITFQSTNVIGE